MEKLIEENVRELVREKYGEIAREKSSCCCAGEAGSTCTEVGESYDSLQGYVPEADLGLGCGLPTALAGIRPGDTVLDLGSGAGNDVFIARRETGEGGRVIGVDFTPDMITRAEKNRQQLGFDNVEFRLGDIENLPLEDETVDVIISNCVLNLVPDKERAFGEMYRVLRPGGHFSVSDIVTDGELPDKLQNAVRLYVGCVSGALDKAEYLEIIQQQGFEAIETAKEREIVLMDEDLREYLSQDEITEFRQSGTRILSVTIRGRRPDCCARKDCCAA